MRQQLSDTATQMFLERGFDAVRVTEIAEACGVSEKTVFNYFPTKESLILDRLEATMASLRTGLAEPGVAPVQAALRILDRELGAMTSWLAAQDDPVQAGTAIRRFDALIQATPSLRAYQSDMMDQFTAVAAAIMAERAGMSPDDPEPQIAATALLGLWRIQFQSLSRYLDGTRTPAQVHQAVTADVRRAAQLIETGLSSFGAFSAVGPGLEHLDHLLAVGAGRAEVATATDIPPRRSDRVFGRHGGEGSAGRRGPPERAIGELVDLPSRILLDPVVVAALGRGQAIWLQFRGSGHPGLQTNAGGRPARAAALRVPIIWGRPHVQFTISGMSRPCLAMYWPCSTGSSCIICLR